MADGPESPPPPFRVENGKGASPFLLLCEHASNFMPRRYGGLGLPEHERARHIAWDIGAADVALALSRQLDAPLVLAHYSRLLIDLNRPPGSATAIPAVSESTEIPGNRALGPEERRDRIDRLFTPFHDRVAALLDERQSTGRETILVTIHSFTPVFKGFVRPWHAGILFRRSQAFGAALVAALGGDAAHVAANQPYQIEDDSDYAIPVHGEARGLEAVLVEIRQDLIADPAGAGAWAGRLAAALQRVRAEAPR